MSVCVCFREYFDTTGTLHQKEEFVVLMVLQLILRFFSVNNLFTFISEKLDSLLSDYIITLLIQYHNILEKEGFTGLKHLNTTDFSFLKGNLKYS